MKKITKIIAVLAVYFVALTACEAGTSYPMDYPQSQWKAKDIDLSFKVDSEKYDNAIGESVGELVVDGETITIECGYDKGTMVVYKLRENSAMDGLSPYDLLFKGSLAEKDGVFHLTVDESTIDSIRVDDEIVFEQVNP